ncbi:MAG: multidrug efflux MFS transporter, partial [Ferrovum sp.]|nr:multidrug efflux MFS transporter [Ferrovum sp.]
FLIGVVLFATLALVPPMLQHEMGYPVLLTGLVTAPRGAGTMLAMIVVGRLVGKFDARLIVGVALGMTALSLWQMTQFDLLMNDHLIITTGVLQGFGIGLAYVPLSTIAFSTLPATLRNEGTAFFNLLRNIGSAIGISVVQTLLTRNTQIMHATLAEHITPYTMPQVAQSHTELLALNGMITRQAAMIAYNNDFKLMMIVTVSVIPLLLFMRPAAHQAGTQQEVAIME